MTEADVDGFLRAMAAAAGPIEIRSKWRPQLRYPADHLLLEVAVNDHAEPIVTRNVTDFEPEQSGFSIRIFTPAQMFKEFLKL